jgi:hypothetical protein
MSETRPRGKSDQSAMRRWIPHGDQQKNAERYIKD